MKYISHKKLEEFCIHSLKNKNVRKDVIDHVTKSLIQTSLRGVDSHGIRLLPHYLDAIDSGRINTNPQYSFEQRSPSTAKLDGDHTFGHAAGKEAMEKAIAKAKETGIGAVAVYNSTHFGAAAFFSLIAADKDMIGMSFTHADSLMLTYNGKRPFFGTNPLCFAAPCDGEDPFCLDMATTRVTWNKIKEKKDENETIPKGWAVDKTGKETTDVEKVAYLIPIGDYKGYGLAMMIEILCSLLTSMPYGNDICRMYDDPIDKKRKLGHFFMAIDIECFEEKLRFKKRLKKMMDEVRKEPSMKGEKIMVPGDPEKKEMQIRLERGIPIDKVTLQKLCKIAKNISFELD
jgi:ureidoglycolate dehydrogenase (NAD+)